MRKKSKKINDEKIKSQYADKFKNNFKEETVEKLYNIELYKCEDSLYSFYRNQEKNLCR